jgi:hypothetical protein
VEDIMKLRHLWLVSFIPLLSSCPDRRLAPIEYEVTKEDRLVIQEGIKSFFDGKLNAELVTLRAHQIDGVAMVTVCGSFVSHDANWQPLDEPTYLVAGVLSDNKAGQRTFSVTSLDQHRRNDANKGNSAAHPPRWLHHISCPE